MTGWWANVDSFEKLYWYFAIPFTLVFIIQLILTFSGMDGDGDIGDDVDFDTDGDSDGAFDGAFRLFTVRNFITFFTVFGWTGITLYNLGVSKAITTVVSVIAGIIVMAIVASLFYFIMKLAESGTLDLQNAIGKTGEVYIPIPDKQKGLGKIHITIQGAVRELDAITTGDGIATGSMVKVSKILDNNILMVKEIKYR